MSSLTSSLLLGLVACAAAAPSSSVAPGNDTDGGVRWKRCSDFGVNATTELECGSLTVPLDYTDPDSGETLDVEILRAPAPIQPSKGSVFVNFGGPGASGKDEMSLGIGALMGVYVLSGVSD